MITLASIGIAARPQRNIGEAGFSEHVAQPREGPGSAAAHRQQIEGEIGVPDRLGAADAGDRLGDQKRAVHWQGRVNRAQQGHDVGVVVIVDHPHQRDDIGALGQAARKEAPADRDRA